MLNDDNLTIKEKQRFEVVLFAQEQGVFLASEKFCKSMKTVTNWLKKYQLFGISGLRNKRRAHSIHPNNKVSESQLFEVIKLKKANQDITAQEIITHLNLNCSIGLIYRKLRSAINQSESFYDKKLTRMLKSNSQEIKNEPVYFIFLRKISKLKGKRFVVGSIELNTGIVNLCHTQEQIGISFILYIDYLLFHLNKSNKNQRSICLITGPANNSERKDSLDRVLSKYNIHNLITKQRVTGFLKRHYPVHFENLDKLISEIAENMQETSKESEVLFSLADYNRNVMKNYPSKEIEKLLYPIQLSDFVSDFEIILEKKDYWEKLQPLSSTLKNHISLLEQNKMLPSQNFHIDDTLNTIKKILLLKDYFNFEQNTASDFLLKKVTLLKSINRIDEACQVFDELIQITDPNDRITILQTKIRSAQFHLVVDRTIDAEHILESISSEVHMIKDPATSGYFYSTKATIKIKKNLFWQAVLLYKRALKAYSFNPENLKKAVVYYELLKIFTLKGDFVKARDFGNQAEHFSGQTTDFRLQSLIFCEIGNLYFHYNLLNNAREYYNKAMNLYSNNNYASGIIHTYNLLGNVSATNCDYYEALKIYSQVRDLSQKHNNLLMYHTALNNLGKIYTNLNDFKSAKYCLKIYLNYVLHQSDFNKIARAYGNLALLYQKMNQNRSATIYFGKALKISNQLGFKHYQAAYLLGLSEVMYSQKKINQAQQYANAALNKSLATSQNELIFQSRLIKMKIAWALSVQKFTETYSQDLDLRPLNSLNQLYENSSIKREKIISGFSLWELITDFYQFTDHAANPKNIDYRSMLEYLNLQQLTNSLLDLINKLPDNQRNNSEYKIISETIMSFMPLS